MTASITARPIPIALQNHLYEDGTTCCFLLKITARDGTSMGVCGLDRDITYDDGDGALLYSAPVGLDLSAAESSSTLEVDNAEGIVLLADAGPFTAEKVDSGYLDNGTFVVYRINWADLTMGHYIPPGGSGTIGAVTNRDGLIGVIELRGWPQILKQNFIDLYSLTCRAKFGSGNSVGTCSTWGSCNFDAIGLWQNNSVSTVSTEEDDRIFLATTTLAATGPGGALPFVPGLVQWLTGNNVGWTSETELASGKDIELRFGTPFPIEAGDTFRARPDCDKTKDTCKDLYDNIPNFRGEWTIPVTDESMQGTPNYTGTWAMVANKVKEELPPP